MRRITLDEALAAGPAALAETDPAVRAKVAAIVDDVRRRRDEAVDEYRARFDPEAAAEFPAIEVPRGRWADALFSIPAPLARALEGMIDRVRAFAARQRAQVASFDVELEEGLRCGQRVTPVGRAACYVPSGRHPLPSSAIMTIVPARVAGVPEIILATPRPHPTVLAVAALCEVDRVLAIGGAHGIAALAYGTGRVPRADVISGPGGVYVAEAKRLVAGHVGTDLPAGPSEVLVLADETADVERVFLDLCAQAEHDPLARPLLGTTSEALADEVLTRVERGFRGHPNEAELTASFEGQGLLAVVASRDDLARLADALAPEHLALHVERPQELLARISSFGAAFLGGATGEVFADYGAGPNHVLPTGGAARFTAGLSVLSYLRLQTTLSLTPDAARAIAPMTALLARAEGLEAHAQAAEARATPAR